MNLTLPQPVQRLFEQLDEVEANLALQAKYVEQYELDRYTANLLVENLVTGYNNTFVYQFTFDISTETVDGKKKYPNKEARDIELELRLDKSEEAEDIREQIKSAKQAQFEANRNNFRCRDLIKDLRLMHNGICTRLGPFTALMQTNTRVEARSGTV